MERVVEARDEEEGACTPAYRLVLRRLLPGAALGDFNAFVEALEALEVLTASVFSGAQGGGLFCCPEAAEAARLLRGAGARGVGQSSWGPLVYGFYPSPARARAAVHLLRHLLLGRRGWRILLLEPRLRGAVVRWAPR